MDIFQNTYMFIIKILIFLKKNDRIELLYASIINCNLNLQGMYCVNSVCRRVKKE